MDKNWNDIKEDIVYLAVVFIDMVDSTNLYQEVGQEEAEKRTNFFRVMAEHNFLKYGGLMGAWHGEGCPIFFREEVSAFKAAVDFIGDIRIRGIERGIEAEIAARISISSGLVEFKKEVGKMNAQFISFGGHFNSACPENSILITEDVYDNLPDNLKVKFDICGTTQRDKIISFIYPKEKKTKKDPEKFLPDTEDPADALRTYLDTIKGQCKTLLFSGIPQSSKIPLLQLTESFFPLKVRRREEKKIERWKEGDEKTTPLMFETTYSEAPPCPFVEIFKKERQIIVLGDPGSGKTTLLRWLCLLYSQGTKVISDKELGDKRLLPLLIPISSLYLERSKTNHINPVDAITNYIANLGARLSSNYIEKRLEKGECLVLLDGLDEIPDKIDRINIAKYLEGFIHRFEKNRFIITSRIIGYEEIRIIGNEYLLTELEEDEIGRFVYNWFLAFERTIQGKTLLAEKEAEKKRDAIVMAVRESSDIKKLAQNPFLLTHICLIQVQGQTLPRYRVELYRRICESLFETWLRARRPFGDILSPPIDYREGEKVLAPLALWMHLEMPGGLVEGTMIKKEIVQIMYKRGIPEGEARESTKEFFGYLADQTQLLVDRGGDKWGFRHRTFEEFLSARALIMNEEYHKFLKNYSYNSQWEEVFLLLSGWIGIIDGRENEVTRIVEGLLERNDELEDILHKNLLLAGKITTENVGIKKNLADDIIEKIISLAMRSEYSTLRVEAIKVLKKAKELSEARLLKILKDMEEKKGVRMRAALALGQIGSHESIPILTSILEDKGEKEEVRMMVVMALGEIGSHESIPILTSILEDKEEKEEVRMMVVMALGEIGSHESIPILTSILKDKWENKWVQMEAARALGEIGSHESIPILTSILEDKEEKEEVRRRAARALGQIGSHESIPILTSILKDKGENEWVRMETAMALGQIGSNESIPILASILEDKGEEEGVRNGAIEALGQIGKPDEEVISILKEIIDQREEGLWISALSSFVKIGQRFEGVEKVIIKELKNHSLDYDNKNRLFNSLWRITL